MKNFIVYLISGEIIRTGQCQDSVFYMQGEYVLEGTANDSLQYIDNGKIVDMPEKPSGATYFDYTIKQWALDYTNQKIDIKNQRDKLLYESDWTQIPNGPLTTEQQQAWADYRQQLRDITSQSGYPFNVVWPTPPQG
jgi:hypothetical protein